MSFHTRIFLIFKVKMASYLSELNYFLQLTFLIEACNEVWSFKNFDSSKAEMNIARSSVSKYLSTDHWKVKYHFQNEKCLCEVKKKEKLKIYVIIVLWTSFSLKLFLFYIRNWKIYWRLSAFVGKMKYWTYIFERI